MIVVLDQEEMQNACMVDVTFGMKVEKTAQHVVQALS